MEEVTMSAFCHSHSYCRLLRVQIEPVISVFYSKQTKHAEEKQKMKTAAAVMKVKFFRSIIGMFQPYDTQCTSRLHVPASRYG